MFFSLCLVIVERNWWEKFSIKFWGDENLRIWYICGWRWYFGFVLGRICNINLGVGFGKFSVVYFCRELLCLRKSYWIVVFLVSLVGGRGWLLVGWRVTRLFWMNLLRCWRGWLFLVEFDIFFEWFLVLFWYVGIMFFS